MKDFIDILLKIGAAPVYFVGACTIGLFGLSYFKEYAFISKAVVLYMLTH